MVTELLSHKPENPIPFMIEHLEKKIGVESVEVSAETKAEYDKIKQEVDYLQMKVDNEKEIHKVTAFKKELEKDDEFDSDTDKEEEEDFVDEMDVTKKLQSKMVNGKLAPRSSVTAEA